MEVAVTVKVEPPDGQWSTANALIKKIAQTCTVGEKLNIEVEGVFGAGKSEKINAGNVVLNGHRNYVAPVVNIS